MKLTPPQLIESWNALAQVMSANEESDRYAQAQRLCLQLRDEVSFWNGLSVDQRMAIQDDALRPYYISLPARRSRVQFSSPAQQIVSAILRGLFFI